MSDYLALKQGGYLLLKGGGRLLLEQQEPVQAGGGGAGGFSRGFHKAHKKHVERMWQEIAKRGEEEADELGAAFDRAHGIVAAASEVLSLPTPAIVPEPILELAQSIPAKQTRERDRQSSRLLKLISELHQAIKEAEEDEEDVWLLLAA